jgi:ribosomal protein S12 methylthiotransferase
MKRWGSGAQFLDLIARIRADEPQAAFRSSFISGFPGETEAMHDELLEFVEAAQLDWAGFFAFSREEGTAAAHLDGELAAETVRERLTELHDVQEPITGAARAVLVGAPVDVLIDRVDAHSGAAVGRTYREAPEIDGLVHVDAADNVAKGAFVRATVHGCDGTDLFASVTAAALERAR